MFRTNESMFWIIFLCTLLLDYFGRKRYIFCPVVSSFGECGLVQPCWFSERVSMTVNRILQNSSYRLKKFSV